MCHCPQDLNFDGDEYALVDTLFSLAEAYLYCQLVELKVEGEPRVTGRDRGRTRREGAG
jgi:hypothetical protein